MRLRSRPSTLEGAPPDLPVLRTCDGRSPLGRSGTAGGGLRVRRRTRHRQGCPQLAGFSGVLQVDGYAAYKALARSAVQSSSPSVLPMRDADSSPRGDRADRGDLCYRGGDPGKELSTALEAASFGADRSWTRSIGARVKYVGQLSSQSPLTLREMRGDRPANDGGQRVDARE
jgi:hypothetical protein